MIRNALGNSDRFLHTGSVTGSIPVSPGMSLQVIHWLYRR